MRGIVFLLVIFSFSKAYPQVDSLFHKANAAYAEGEYEAAIEHYEQILESGNTAAEVHYNLANAHYKLNNIGPSVYHYEKALLLDPHDPDILNNLEFARNMTIDAIEEEPENAFTRWWNGILGSLSTTAWAATGIVFMVLFVVFFLLYYFSSNPFRKRIFFISGVIFLLFSLTGVALGFTRANQLENQNFAVILAEEVEVNSEPGSRGEELYLLHEGTKVEVVEDFQEWIKIRLPNDSQGWILREAAKKL